MLHLLLKISLLTLLIIFGSSCQKKQEPAEELVTQVTQTAIDEVPEWTREAIWYQIFVERFRNGDTNNDPRPQDMRGAFPDTIPTNWKISDWGQDWYTEEEWQKDVPLDNFHAKIQLRRYGGDLQGVLDKIDYLADLGINAVYFNPLNDAPSLHKYDARSYHHIDRNFGPDPDGDAKIMAEEDPGDPSTWKWTAADKLFLEVVDALHKKGIRVVLDYSWNHVSPTFWAIQDIKEKGKDSKYLDWFNITSFDDPDTPENEFEFEGWAGTKHMVVVSKEMQPTGEHEFPAEGNLPSESLKQHIFAVSKRWLDPNNDGNTARGVDGFRLDVAAELPMGFWRDYRSFVRSVKPDAYLLGEIWWQTWPHELMDPRPYLQGDQFDAIMNYRWYRIARGFFAQAGPQLTPSGFVGEIERINKDIPLPYQQAMMNMSSSHDVPRLSTSFFNKNLYKFEAKPTDNPTYKIHKPDQKTWQEVRQFLVHQFTFVGAPQIWNGDEMGMWGADDPDCRKPLIWDDIDFEPETRHLLDGQDRPTDSVEQDKELLAFYKQLIAIRKSQKALVQGDLYFLLQNDEDQTLAYRRKLDDNTNIIAFNRAESEQTLSIPVKKNGMYTNLLTNEQTEAKAGKLEISLPALGYAIFKQA